MKYTLTFILFVSLLIAEAQTKYLNSVYTDIEKTTYTYSKSKGDSLQLDFYKAKKSLGLQPLILFVHGGGFSGGSRDTASSVDFATRMAKRGYMVASISYQLTMRSIGFGCNVDASLKIGAFDNAADDIAEATRFILKNDSLLTVDVDKIILAGTSAGAEAALHLAYTKEDNKLPRKFKYAGVISMAGALLTLQNLSEDTAIPTLLFHGTNDNLVPYYIAAHHFCGQNEKGYLMLYGSKAIAEKLKGLGKSYYLFSVLGGTHGWSSFPISKAISEISDFLYHDVINNAKRQTERTITN